DVTVGALTVASHHQRVGVLFDGHDGADGGQLIEHPGLQGEVLADGDAGDIRWDRFEFATELDGCLGLEVVHVHVRRATRQVDHDGGLQGRGAGGGVCACLEHPG